MSQDQPQETTTGSRDLTSAEREARRQRRREERRYKRRRENGGSRRRDRQQRRETEGGDRVVRSLAVGQPAEQEIGAGADTHASEAIREEMAAYIQIQFTGLR